MKKTWFHTRKDFKGKVALQELKRAHIIIALLSISLAFIILVMSVYPIQFDVLLASIVSALLIITTAVSLSIAFTIKT
ncbi:MAG: hypothetical protein ABIQ04_02760 [Candidatus Saccharimonadales bacterium]